jgi:oligoendopeptidase F
VAADTPMRFEQTRWSLEDLFASFEDPGFGAALQDVEAKVAAFEGWRDRLTPNLSPDDLRALLAEYEALLRVFSRVYAFAQLAFAADTQDQQAQTYLAKTQQMAAVVENRTLFFKLWWKALDDAAAARLQPAAGDAAYFLEALRLQRPYTLSEPEEQVINLKDVNGAAAMINLYDTITNRYVFRLTVDGEEKEMTRGELSMHFQGTDPDLRAAAYRELLRVFSADAPVLGQLYQYRARDWRSENVDLRHFASPIAVRNLGNDIPDAVVETLLDVCRSNAGLFQRYFRLKARWLGMECLRRFDVYAPVVKSDKPYSFREAVELTLGSFAAFDPQMAGLARRVLDTRHLDSEVRKGKRTGAFCASVEPTLVPWVLTSYQGRSRDIATLAHELGHAVHGLLAARHSALTADATLPLAETASTFGEMLLVDYLLAHDPDPDVQRDLFFRQMDDAYGTIMRQAYFALFERQAHDMILQDASVDDLSRAYLGNLKEQFGDSLDLSEEFKVEWVAIPHIFHTPFYVYAYAFGQLLVLSLYEQYRREKAAFKPRYFEILSAGGSDAPARILERAGIDIRSAAFWQGGFHRIEEALTALEKLPLVSR